MERLKSLKEILEPDARQKHLVTRTPSGGTRPLTLEDFYNRAKEIELHDGVPENIRNHFQTARHLLIYSWLYYPFQRHGHASSLRFH